jgi:exosome complex component MTR3
MLSNCKAPKVVSTSPIEEVISNKIIIKKSKNINTNNNIRIDGRNNLQLGKISCNTGVIKDSSGSAFFQIGDTKVICSVHGPRQHIGGMSSEFGVVECEFKYAKFATEEVDNRKIQLKENHLSGMLKDALQSSVRLDNYPKSVISINVVILQCGSSSGSDLSAAICCGSLALTDASVELFDFVSSCCVCKIFNDENEDSNENNKQKGIVVDPTAIENKNSVGSLTVAQMSSSHINEISLLLFEGRLEASIMSEVLQIGTDACSYLRLIMSDCLQEKIKLVIKNSK